MLLVIVKLAIEVRHVLLLVLLTVRKTPLARAWGIALDTMILPTNLLALLAIVDQDTMAIRATIIVTLALSLLKAVLNVLPVQVKSVLHVPTRAALRFRPLSLCQPELRPKLRPVLLRVQPKILRLRLKFLLQVQL